MNISRTLHSPETENTGVTLSRGKRSSEHKIVPAPGKEPNKLAHFMPVDVAHCHELQPALVQLVEEARSYVDDGALAAAVLIAVRDQLVALTRSERGQLL